MSEIIQVEALSKRYGEVEAVKGVSFGIKEGICFGLLGPNGAGKTTTIEMMEGIIRPSNGRILFRGQPIDKHFRQKVGIQFQSTSLPEFITVRETIEMFRAFYDNPRSMDELIELCSLSDILERDNRKLSGGQKQRMLLALAIIPHPDLVFLDEPTTGLDPQARRHFWELIGRIKAENATIILTTHYMDEAQLLCDQIAIMDHGKIIEQDTPSQLLTRHFGGVILRLPKVPQTQAVSKIISAESTSTNTSGADSLVEKADTWDILSYQLEHTINKLLASGVNLEGLSVHKPDLEDLFIKLTGSSLRT